MEDKQRRNIGEGRHEDKLSRGPFPRAGFFGDDGGGGQALQGVDVEDEQGDDRERGEDRRSIRPGGGGDFLPQGGAGFLVVVGFLDAE